MKKDIIFLRTKRTGSTNFYGGLAKLEKHGIINTWWGKSHMNVNKCRALCIEEKSEDYWNNAIKVVGIRNPWIQQVSLYLMRQGREKKHNITTGPGLKKLIQGFREHMKKPREELHGEYLNNNWEIHADGNKSLADVYMRLENLEGSLRKLASLLRHDAEEVLDAFGHMLNVNDSTKDSINRYDWKDFYNKETKDLVYEMRKQEIERFGYKFKSE